MEEVSKNIVSTRENIFVRFFKHIKRRLREQLTKGIAFNICSLIAFLWALSLFLVILWGINISLTEGLSWALDPNRFFPEKWYFENYKKAFQTIAFDETNYFGMIFNSVWFAFGSTFMKLLSTVCFAYIIARFEFKGRKFLYGFVLVQMMLPTYGQTTANYLLLDSFGIIDSPLFLLAMGAGHGMYFLICHSFFETLPKSYEEAASIDGAGYMRTFLKIMLPLSRPILISIGLLTFISCWNDYATTLLYLPSYPTLTSGLYRYKTVAVYTLDQCVYFAGVFLSSLPVVVLFIVFNKTLMENMSIGGIKG